MYFLYLLIMKKLIILRGVPGSGKSTYAKNLIKYLTDVGFTAVSYEADTYFYDKDGNYNWNPDLLNNAHMWCQHRVSEALMTHDFVIVANTNIDRKSVQKYIKIAKECNAEYVVLRLGTRFQNVHEVPAEVVENMPLLGDGGKRNQHKS